MAGIELLCTPGGLHEVVFDLVEDALFLGLILHRQQFAKLLDQLALLALREGVSSRRVEQL